MNMALYRLLLKIGANEADAEAAARVDISELVTKADLKAEVADLKAELLKWTIGIVFTAIGVQTALIAFMLSRLGSP
jgi:hypothetical protein